MTTKEQLSQLLKQELAARSLSIAALAKEAQVTYEVVRSVVQGQSESSWTTTNKILAPLGYQMVLSPTPPEITAPALAVAGGSA